MQIAECGHEFISTEPVCRQCGQPMQVALSHSTAAAAARDPLFRKLALGVLTVSALLGLGMTAALVMLGTGGGRKAQLNLATPSDLNIARENAQQVILGQSSRLIPGAPDAKDMFPPDEQDGDAHPLADAAGHPAHQVAMADDADADGEDADAGPADKPHARIIVHQVSTAPVAEGGEARPLDLSAVPPARAPVPHPAARPVMPPAAAPAPAVVPRPAVPVVEINGDPKAP